ncbi:cell division protein FtsW (lipid II flippase) [Sporosarcina luteola]|nr:cell division protein FtsW (lipid II flippase) [Sporosarcina luteola]
MHERSESFLDEVKSQINSKEAKEFVAAELSHHLIEAKNKWMTKGLDETAAEEKAVGHMGNPVMLGHQLNKLHRPKIDWLMIVLLAAVMGIGFLPVLFIGADYYSTFGLDANYFLTRKAVLVVLGGAIAIGMMLMDYRKLEKFSMRFYGAGLLILILLVHSQSYMAIGPLRIEALMAIPLFLLAWAAIFNQKKLPTWKIALFLLLSIYLLSMAATLPTIIIYLAMVLSVFLMSSFSWKRKWIIMVCVVGFLLLLSFVVWPYTRLSQIDRFLAFINPEQFAEGDGYLILLFKEHISNAGWFGNVLGSGRIPEVHNDYVFAGFTYYFGWLAAGALVLLLSLFIVRIMMITRTIQDPFGKLLLIGAVAMYTVQLVGNVAMTLGLLPITSLSLPFISYGVMPILLNAFIMGIVLSVYRRKDLLSVRIVESQQ